MKIKLPRKRKKAFIDEYGKSEYHTRRLLNEECYEKRASKLYTKFPEYKGYYGLIKFYW